MATLFENNTYEALTTLQLYVQNCIQNNEPRVNLIDVQIYSDPYNENEIEVTIIYNLINNPSPINFTLLLKRVR